ncbi:hypothetical protein CANTEDRAFT_114027 [Yamadazyma tenuis ATCC 10573]|uniref:NAD(P)-binding protein n=1 Tax=Candida tenuis (strain ATCC 10573 / BCRC 21748 / CBS 615 / JCM 9827 / NBRC 10315 / NRRL Y-1498 / VKM Y-70) TaxID=590646 RepID=G3B4P6_CANTC|nr:NAD(P)-binding protein [Yamadazyma tenuis ATCC 10573]XP_006686632.1 uncharacterized protein CANTEDRAFT_114027 [Yamadazyma tenuis ATCC 10573]EGV64317.1 NAD(P)-binding protein [Yamadazyma tenuis ATCC 10573]EGV64318.1 hypothetical protein CANTEDRAFT_114027 [Yamadazyma tenuis ATCC 10573]
MAPQQSHELYVHKNPVKEMDLDVDSPNATFKIRSTDLPALKDGQVLVKNLMFSNDPSQRAWIQKDIPAESMYVAPIRQGQAMSTLALSQVVESNNKGFSAGDLVRCSTSWSDYAVVDQQSLFDKIPENSGFSLDSYLDILGFTSLTAWFGVYDVAQLKASDVLVVSGAAGATGSVVVQIAKNIIGCKKVIGIAGGKDKCDFVKSIGADDCLDYKAPKLLENMKQALGDDECDVFFDGVGGRILDMMLLLTKQHGQIIACGSVAGYNNASASSVNAWGLITTRRLTVKGFIILDYFAKFSETTTKLIEAAKAGKLQNTAESKTVVDLSRDPDFLKRVPKTYNMLFNGEKKNGKLITKIAEPQSIAKL